MFKTLTRTLKLGLTAITILTAGGFAGTAFAQTTLPQKYEDDFIAFCTENRYSSMCRGALTGCLDQPFSDGCRGVYTPRQSMILKVRSCAYGNNYRLSNCAGIIAGPNAANWVSQNSSAPNAPSFRGSKFLRGTVRGVARFAARSLWYSSPVNSDATRGSLNLKTATFNDVALGGDITAGVGFFDAQNASRSLWYSYAGIFSGTALGERITEIDGNAQLVGTFQTANSRPGVSAADNAKLRAGVDFVLDVDYARRTLSGYILDDISHDVYGDDFKFDGGYSVSGIITGKLVSSRGDLNTVTGLIGQKGAVGAFIGNFQTKYSSGGFVVRPAHLVVAENGATAQAYLDKTCKADPFRPLCFTSNERATRIFADCAGTLPSPRPAHCSDATVACVNNPFGTDCHRTLGGHALGIARASRITLCNRESTLISNPLCTPTEVVAAICDINLFGTGCLRYSNDNSVYNNKRTALITTCNEAGGASNPLCMPTEVVTAICDINLFGTGCLRYSKDNSVYNNKRTVRITTCNEAGGASNPLCMPADVVAEICDNNLFGTGCLRSSIHNPERANILNSCTTNSGDSDCTDLNLNSVCNYAPFAPLCVGNDDYASRREDTFETCKNRDSDILSCNGVRQAQAPSGKADAATWADSFITLANLKGISSITSVDLLDVQYTKSQFLEGLKKDFDFPHLPTRGKTPFTTLTLANNLVDSTKTLRGESEDGVAFFGLRATDYGHIAFPFYAGILSGTDLGAPITRITGTKAIWSGVFQAIGGRGRATHKNFDLTVTFTDSKTGTIDAFVNSTDDNYYHLTGNFDSIGVITGRVDYGSFDSSKNPTGDRLPGRLTGLIGEQGAVGAFIADMYFGKGFYAGGFVARAVVDYADWEASANPLDAIGTTTGNKFLSGGTDTLLDTTRRSIVLNLADATHNRIGLGGDSTDGVAFFKNPEIGFNALYYAGVLSGTDLGLPIEPGASGDWKGSIRMVYGSGIWNPVDFNLTVTLGGTADDVNQAGIITAVANGVLEDNNNPQSLHINGKLNYKGVITGTVDLGNRGYATGILKGLIGQEGAVGAFISNGSSPFSGGFVARPDLVQVTSANLATLQTKPRDITNSGFLTASNTGLPTDSVSLPQGHELSGEQMILRRGGADSDNPDGIAYFFTTADSGNTSFSYGGILSTTNLGAPVESTQASAIWKGHHSYRDSLIENEKTDFYVNFAEGKFGFTNDGRNGIGSVVMTPFANNPEVTFTLNGLFGSQNNMTVGQLGGTLDYTFTTQTALDGGKYQPGDTVLYQYNVHGLIGQEGAVGVYLEESVNASRVGGFVASAQ
ncbi:MAG: hypothetical protein K0U41_08695 [Gammaproteobacteria bacterium]|nr:hypothetical protein [Gammaproteobacteria bacterium]